MKIQSRWVHAYLQQGDDIAFRSLPEQEIPYPYASELYVRIDGALYRASFKAPDESTFRINLRNILIKFIEVDSDFESDKELSWEKYDP